MQASGGGKGHPNDDQSAPNKGVGEEGQSPIDEAYRSRKHVREIAIQDPRRRLHILELERERGDLVFFTDDTRARDRNQKRYESHKRKAPFIGRPAERSDAGNDRPNSASSWPKKAGKGNPAPLPKPRTRSCKFYTYGSRPFGKS